MDTALNMGPARTYDWTKTAERRNAGHPFALVEQKTSEAGTETDASGCDVKSTMKRRIGKEAEAFGSHGCGRSQTALCNMR